MAEAAAYLVMEFVLRGAGPKLVSLKISDTPANKLEHKQRDHFYAQLDDVHADTYGQAHALLVAMCYALPRLAWTNDFLEDMQATGPGKKMLARCKKRHTWDITLYPTKIRSRRDPKRLISGFISSPPTCPTCGESSVRIDDPKKVMD